MIDISATIKAVVEELDGDKAGAAKESKKKGRPKKDKPPPEFEEELPEELVALIEHPSSADLSKEFHHAVCWMGDLGWSAGQIEARITGKPIVPERYTDRLGEEIERCLGKRSDDKSAASKDDLARLNKVHAVLPIGGKTRVVTFGELTNSPVAKPS